MEILKNPHYDFLGKARILITLSVVLILAGILYISRRGVHYGVEFSGGTQIIVRFQSPPAVDRVRAAVDPDAPGAVIQTYGEPAKNQVLIRRAGTEGDVESSTQRILRALAERYPENRVVESSSEVVGPVVGAQLRKKAVQLTLIGLAFQLVYIAIRFKGAIWG